MAKRDIFLMDFLAGCTPPPYYSFPEVASRWGDSYDMTCLPTYIKNYVSERTWSSSETGQIRLVTYNVLADSNVDSSQYPSTPENDLNPKRRVEYIKAELAHLNADLYCLQEIDDDVSLPHLIPGYSTVYKKRTGLKHDGVAIAWKPDKFELISYYEIEYKSRSQEKNFMDRDNVGLIAVLREVNGGVVILATTHLLFNFGRGEIQLGQLVFFLKSVEHARSLYSSETPRIIITGDLNFIPNCPMYQLLSQGTLNLTNLNKKALSKRQQGHYKAGQMEEKWEYNRKRTMGDFSYELDEVQGQNNVSWATELHRMEIAVDGNTLFPMFNEAQPQPSDALFLSHSLNLVNAYTPNEYPTFCAPGNVCTVDYIFVSQNVQVKRQLALPESEKLLQFENAMPNKYFPSDHLALSIEF